MGAGGAMEAGGSDPGAVFDKSLGDFDKQMQTERERMASSGQGSGGSAAGRESADASQVDKAGSGGMSGTGGMGGFGEVGGSMGGAGGQSGAGGNASAGDASQNDAAKGDSGGGGDGQDVVKGEFEGGDFEDSERDGGRVAEIPEDIPTDGTGDDQVAEQIREAAMAETDPVIRDALWEEYRRHTGIK